MFFSWKISAKHTIAISSKTKFNINYHMHRLSMYQGDRPAFSYLEIATKHQNILA